MPSPMQQKASSLSTEYTRNWPAVLNLDADHVSIDAGASDSLQERMHGTLGVPRVAPLPCRIRPAALLSSVSSGLRMSESSRLAS